MVSETDLSRRSFVGIAAGLSTAAFLSGCATTTAQPGKAPSETSDYFFQTMAARSDVVSTVNFDAELTDWLPNRLFEIDGETPRPLGAGLAVGRITKVAGGRGYVVGETDEAGEPVTFDSPDALWRTVDVVMSVARSWGEVASGGTVQFGVAFGGNKDASRMIASLSSLETIVVALLRPGFFRYNPELYSVGRNGVLLGTVDNESGLHFPSLSASTDDDADEEKKFLASVRTANDLESQADKGRTVIQIKGGERI